MHSPQERQGMHKISIMIYIYSIYFYIYIYSIQFYIFLYISIYFYHLPISFLRFLSFSTAMCGTGSVIVFESHWVCHGPCSI